MGGTWDLFRYPGIRSDSDMHTLGYAFKPWRESKAIADGPAANASSNRRAGAREMPASREPRTLPAPSATACASTLRSSA